MTTDGVPAGDEARIKELEAEVARLQTKLDRQPKDVADTAKPPSHRWRTFWSVVCITVACLLAPLSIAAVWARGEVTDTERYVATVAPLASDPAIQSAVSSRITEEILNYIDIPALTQEAIGTISTNRDLTPRQVAALTALAGPLDSGIEGFIGDKVTQIVQSDTFAAAWTEANTRAHTRLNQVLSGDTTGPVSIEGNDVTLDLGQVLAQVKQDLVNRGFTVAEKIPTVDTQIVIFQSDNLAAAQRAYSALDTLGFWLPIVAVVLALVGVFVAQDSRKGLIGFGIGLSLAALASAVLLAVGRTEYLNALPDTVNAPAATAFFDTLTYYLRQALWAALAAGVVLILAGILTGPTRFAKGVRGLASRGAGAIQGQLAEWGAGMDGVRGWVAGNAGGLRIGASLLAIGFIMLTRYKTVSLIVWTTVALLVVLFIIQILASDRKPSGDKDEEPRSATPEAA